MFVPNVVMWKAMSLRPPSFRRSPECGRGSREAEVLLSARRDYSVERIQKIYRHRQGDAQAWSGRPAGASPRPGREKRETAQKQRPVFQIRISFTETPSSGPGRTGSQLHQAGTAHEHPGRPVPAGIHRRIQKTSGPRPAGPFFGD